MRADVCTAEGDCYLCLMAAFRRPSGVSVRWRQLAAAAVYLAVVAFLVVEGRSEPLTSQGRSPDALSFVILAVASLALLLRHRAPLLVAGGAGAALVVWRDVLDYQSRGVNIPLLLALYAVALARP